MDWSLCRAPRSRKVAILLLLICMTYPSLQQLNTQQGFISSFSCIENCFWSITQVAVQQICTAVASAETSVIQEAGYSARNSWAFGSQWRHLLFKGLILTSLHRLNFPGCRLTNSSERLFHQIVDLLHARIKHDYEEQEQNAGPQHCLAGFLGWGVHGLSVGCLWCRLGEGLCQRWCKCRMENDLSEYSCACSLGGMSLLVFRHNGGIRCMFI